MIKRNRKIPILASGHALFLGFFPALLLFFSVDVYSQTVALNTSKPLSGKVLGVKMYNVGQGNCVLVKYPNDVFLLVDCGSTSHGVDKSKIAAQIDADVGKGKISTVVLSHPDDDHINIVPYIKTAEAPSYIHISQSESDYPKLAGWLKTAKGKGANVRVYPANYAGTMGPNPYFKTAGSGLDVYILAANVTGDNNTKSIVVSVDYTSSNVLLTGDATRKTENFILQNWPKWSFVSDLVLLGHHGSNHSSSKNFLVSAVRGVVAFSASAAHLGYGHPRCIVVDTVKSEVDHNGVSGVSVKNHNVKCWEPKPKIYKSFTTTDGIFLTATQGNIVFKTDGAENEVLVDTL